VLARHDRAVAARTLREAADQLERDGMKRLSANSVKQWLRARADLNEPVTPPRDPSTGLLTL
jgi:hypothetical protein